MDAILILIMLVAMPIVIVSKVRMLFIHYNNMIDFRHYQFNEEDYQLDVDFAVDAMIETYLREGDGDSEEEARKKITPKMRSHIAFRAYSEQKKIETRQFFTSLAEVVVLVAFFLFDFNQYLKIVFF